MILRDIPLTPWPESPSSWHFAEVDVGGGNSVGVFRRTPTNHPQNGPWSLYYNRADARRIRAGIARADYRTDHANLDEFEAQAVLDHYVQTIGIAA